MAGQLMARPFHPSMGRAVPPRRDLPGWVWAAVMLLVLVGSAWTGAHGGPTAVIATAAHVVAVAVLVWVCIWLLAVACLVVVVLALVLIIAADEADR